MRSKDDEWRVYEDFESCRNGIFEGTISALIWKLGGKPEKSKSG
jgi:hypothetical protein